MRTTLDIDDDLLAAAKELARREGRSAGQVVSAPAAALALGRRGQGASACATRGFASGCRLRAVPREARSGCDERAGQRAARRRGRLTAMRALLDVNVLVALLDGGHLHHAVATSGSERTRAAAGHRAR